MLQINKDIKNPELVQAILNLHKNQSVQSQVTVLNEIGTRAQFIAPVIFSNKPQKNEDGTYSLPEDTKLSFSVITNSKGKKFFPAYTDTHQLSKSEHAKNQDTVILTFDDYARLVLHEKSDADGFVINPDSNMSLLMDKNLISQLKEKKEATLKRMNASKAPGISLTEFDRYPEEFAKLLSEVLQNITPVKSAYLRAMVKDGVKSNLLIVEHDGDEKEIFSEIANASKEYITKDCQLNIISLDSDFAKSAVKDTNPIYKR